MSGASELHAAVVLGFIILINLSIHAHRRKPSLFRRFDTGCVKSSMVYGSRQNGVRVHSGVRIRLLVDLGFCLVLIATPTSFSCMYVNVCMNICLRVPVHKHGTFAAFNEG